MSNPPASALVGARKIASLNCSNPMKRTFKVSALFIAMAATHCLPLLAGTLDTAPFKIAAPDADWKMDDSKSEEVGKDVVLIASLTHDKKEMKSVVLTGPVKPNPPVLSQLCAGIRDSFANPAVKKISDTETTFLGYKAQALAYEVTQGGQTTYNEARVFVAQNKPWIISFSGPLSQKEAIKQMITYYQPKKP